VPEPDPGVLGQSLDRKQGVVLLVLDEVPEARQRRDVVLGIKGRNDDVAEDAPLVTGGDERRHGRGNSHRCRQDRGSSRHPAHAYSTGGAGVVLGTVHRDLAGIAPAQGVPPEGGPGDTHHRQRDAPFHGQESGVGAEGDARDKQNEDWQQRPVGAPDPPGQDPGGHGRDE
jgi:hypothetical protein